MPSAESAFLHFDLVGLTPAPDDLAPEELAAWTSVLRVVLNLDETCTRN